MKTVRLFFGIGSIMAVLGIAIAVGFFTWLISGGGWTWKPPVVPDQKGGAE